MFANVQNVKVGIVAVSRDCFPKKLSERRRRAWSPHVKRQRSTFSSSQGYTRKRADRWQRSRKSKPRCKRRYVVYLGTSDPRGGDSARAKFGGPVMFAAAAEETQNDLIDGRGDAYCGMLNASYNLGLRGIKAYIPEYPVGTAEEIAGMIGEFTVIARVLLSLKKLKIFAFGPRPYDFLACNAPIKGLYDLGVEIQENSELDLYESFLKHEDDPRIPEVIADMEAELSEKGNRYPGVLPRLAQYELTLLDWAKRNLGASEHFAFANKCWPAFQTMFKFVPCYVNSRLAARGIPVACETDIYGALTEFILYQATGIGPTLLDLNNTFPRDKFTVQNVMPYSQTTCYGFHCATPRCALKDCKMHSQLIMSVR